MAIKSFVAVVPLGLRVGASVHGCPVALLRELGAKLHPMDPDLVQRGAAPDAPFWTVTLPCVGGLGCGTGVVEVTLFADAAPASGPESV